MNWLKRLFLGGCGLVLSVACQPMAEAALSEPSYVVVASQATADVPDWRAVADTLVTKHQGKLLVYRNAPDELLPALQAAFPRYVCFLATPTEASREYVGQLHRLMRRWDDDPYADALWGVLTGVEPAAAQRIARQSEPLVVRRVLSGTEIALEMCEEGVWYSELERNRMVRKARGGQPQAEKGPDDTTAALAESLSAGWPDLFVTSGHATERDWQIAYRYRGGQFRSSGGLLTAIDAAGKQFPIQSANPKVYLPIGNCLMGHIDGPDAMALAMMNAGGVNQMIGYTVPTWYGYAGWGCLDYYLEQPGRFTLTEAFCANQHALIHRLNTYFPAIAAQDTDAGSPRQRLEDTLSTAARQAGLTANDGAGLWYDRDVLAFYGDPAWEARMAPGPCAWRQTLTCDGDTYRLEIEPARGATSFEPTNTNGSQRGGRPVVAYLPHRVRDVEIVEGAEFHPTITDDFILVPQPKPSDQQPAIRVVFRAKKLGG